MCGIAGIVNFHKQVRYDSLLDEILVSQHARGPDYQGKIFVEDEKFSLYFGHNRLSIIDIDERSHQPLWDKEKKCCLIFNGEIYNYVELRKELENLGRVFTTHSDSEVLLQAYLQWGNSSFNRLNGAFAFALFDKTNKKIILCRDRFGKKPLYYFSNKNAFYFASTSQAIAKHEKLMPNFNYLLRGINYCVYENGQAETQYQGLQSLLPSHWMEINLAQSTLEYNIHRYYDLSAEVAKKRDQLLQMSTTDLIHSLRDVFNDAVTIRLRSDVPLCFSLSGGIDSSAIGGYIHQRLPETTAITFGQLSYKKSEARAVEHFSMKKGIKVQYAWPTVEGMWKAYLKTLRTQDAPFPSLSIVAQHYLFESASENGYKVILGGQGGDEAFMGYNKFLYFNLLSLFKEKSYGELTNSLIFSFPIMFRQFMNPRQFIKVGQRYFNNHPSKNIFCVDDKVTENFSVKFQKNQSLLDRQLLDITQCSLPTLLRYEDRNSLGNSIETRLPLMDYRIVEFGMALPVNLKIHKATSKWIFRQAIQSYSTPELINNRCKNGFNAQDAYWISQGFGKKLRERLDATKTRYGQFLKEDINIENYFSDKHLSDSRCFAEATTLFWLSQLYE